MPDPAQPAFRVVEIEDGQGGGGDTPRAGRFARLRQPKAEVRRCGRCNAAALICCQAWEHSFNGMSSGAVTRDCRCQACGADVTLYDPKSIRGVRIAGYILMLTVFMGPIFLIAAWRRGRAWDQNPLVPDAPRPKIRSWRGPGNRRCGGCGKIAQLVGITRHRHNGIPTGTDCSYACPSCQRAFVTESAGGIAFGVLGGGLIALAGGWWFLAGHDDNKWRIFGGPAIALVGAWLVLRALRHVAAAIANPALQGEDAAA
jgi:hypothetical protein